MSNFEYDVFSERVMEFIENTQGMSYIPKRADELYKNREWQELETFMREVESNMAIEDFYNRELIPKSEED